MPWCVVTGCRNSDRTNSSGSISFHRFPKDNCLRETWIRACNRADDFVNSNARVCSAHFEASDYERDLKGELLNIKLRRQLKSTSVPHVNVRNDDNTMEKLIKEDVAICQRCNIKDVEAEPIDSVFKLNCDECAMYRTKKAREKWIGEKEAIFLTCLYCWRSFMLEQPLEPHQCSLVDIFPCEDCGQRLYSGEDLRKHTRYLHKKETRIDNGQCEKCGTNYLGEHVCLQESSVISLREKVKSGTNRKRIDPTSNRCKFCMQEFSDFDDLKAHVRTHTGDKPYQCNICPKTFVQLGHLTRHIRTHSGEKPFRCSICNKEFSQSANLKTHIKNHNGERPYECDICQKRFLLICKLKRHVLSHTGQKDYKCNICEKRFPESRNLKRHVFTHTGEKPFECNICPRKFTQSSDLVKHVRTHTGEKPYQCNFCERKFSESGSLKEHTRTHTGEKPYQCKICWKTFAKSGNLNAHIRIHNK